VGKGLERIDELRRDAAAMVEDHLQMTETERKRLKEYKEFQESYATHREYVRLVGENTEAALDFIAELETHMEAARETIRNMRVEERVAELSQEERKRLDEHYTVFSGRTARRAHALSVRTTNSQRQHSEAVFQHRQAGACDDPEGKTHAERGEALDKSVMVLRQRLAEVEAIFDEGQERYTALMAAEDGFDPEHNAAVTAAKLRTSLREQYSTSLDGLSKQQATVTSELHGKAVDHDQKANAARLMAEKKREKRLLANGSAAQSPSKAPSADEAVAE
jgi:predicted nuclease with TOPRIM domain